MEHTPHVEKNIVQQSFSARKSAQQGCASFVGVKITLFLRAKIVRYMECNNELHSIFDF